MRMLLFLLLFPLLLPPVLSLNCSIKQTCGVGESCVFSMYATTNSHVGSCGYYSYEVCCDEITVGIRDECLPDEGEILSLFQSNNSHVAQAGYYPKKVCAKYSTYPLDCSIRTACYENETCVVSLFSLTNSHVADCSYYPNKLCCRKLPDLYVNQSSITPNTTSPVYGDPVELNITVWNIGDAAAPNVNVSCYENGTYFDSDVIISIPPDPSMQTPRYATCQWTASCYINLSVRVDPANEIQELNETNNEAWKLMSITEILSITIDSPITGQQFYRGQTINLNSTVSSSCHATPTDPYTVTWYNDSIEIGTGEDIIWTIPLDDGLLGTKTINATATGGTYVNASDTVQITILNNLPVLTTPAYNVTPPEVVSGDAIEISCDVTDVEDPADALQVNISIKDPDGVWDNATASHIGNTFYRDYIAPYSPLGYYTVVCSAVDTDGGYNESASSTFLVYQNGTVILSLNATEVWWNDPVEINGTATRTDGTPLSTTNVEVLIGGENVCPMAATDSNGFFSCEFNAPKTVGVYEILVRVTDPQTDKLITNTTTLNVKPTYGGTKEEERRAKSVGCYEVPRFIQNPDGTIKKVIVRICVWK